MSAKNAWSASGTEGASFLDIPVGAAPTGMGSAYTAMASDAYAPVWNPAGLGQLNSTEVTGTHLSYLETLHYEFLSGALPIGDGRKGIGASVQYLGSGNIDGRDSGGLPTGSFSSSFAAYSIAYGQKMSDDFSVGVTGKAISESISDASAKAYAGDFGALYRYNEHLTLGSTLTNIGTAIKLAKQADPLPSAFHLGGVYDPDPQWRLALEGVYRRSGLASAQMGVQWKYGDLFALRGGYNTSHVQGLSSAFDMGLSLYFMGQEFSYAWMPYGTLGDTNYFSLTFRFGGSTENVRSARAEEPAHSASSVNMQNPSPQPAHRKLHDDSADYDSIYDVLTDSERKSLKNQEAGQ